VGLGIIVLGGWNVRDDIADRRGRIALWVGLASLSECVRVSVNVSVSVSVNVSECVSISVRCGEK
jgi:hypothetical protein